MAFSLPYRYIKQGYEYHHSTDERMFSHLKYKLKIMNYELKKVANVRLSQQADDKRFVPQKEVEEHA